MKVEILKNDFEKFYSRAKKGYQKCIEGNGYLQNQVDIPISSIVIKEHDVKIVFVKDITDMYQVDIRLILYAAEDEIGEYVYSLDEEDEVVDDMLLFY